MEQFLLVNNKQ